MRAIDQLEHLIDVGAIQRVVRPLMAGKEAEVFLVVHDGVLQVAKVYKEATARSFKHRAQYTEGRKVRSSRSQRAMSKRSKFGRKEEETAWRTTEVDMLFRAWDAGVRVPQPLMFQDSVLIMELIRDEHGEPAPRLVDMDFTPAEARKCFLYLVNQTQRMLCAGIVHGDLSDFNVLMGFDGPAVIDFPQAVDPANNNNAQELLVRDVRNLSQFLGRYAPSLKKTEYGEEMWQLYEGNQLTPDTPLTGKAKRSDRKADVNRVLEEIAEAAREENFRRRGRGEETVSIYEGETPAQREKRKREEAMEIVRKARARRAREEDAEKRAAGGGGNGGGGNKKKRRRKKKPGGGQGGQGQGGSQQARSKGSGERSKRRGSSEGRSESRSGNGATPRSGNRVEGRASQGRPSGRSEAAPASAPKKRRRRRPRNKPGGPQ